MVKVSLAGLGLEYRTSLCKIGLPFYFKKFLDIHGVTLGEGRGRGIAKAQGHVIPQNLYFKCAIFFMGTELYSLDIS